MIHIVGLFFNSLFRNNSYISFHFRRDTDRYGQLSVVQRME